MSYVPGAYSFGVPPGAMTVAVVLGGIVNVHSHVPFAPYFHALRISP